MAIFLDTGIFVAARNSRDISHERASQLVERALIGNPERSRRIRRNSP